MSSRLTRSGAREHDRKKRSGRSGWRMLTWPNESTMPYLASTWFAVTRSSIKSSSFAMSGFLPDGCWLLIRTRDGWAAASARYRYTAVLVADHRATTYRRRLVRPIRAAPCYAAHD